MDTSESAFHRYLARGELALLCIFILVIVIAYVFMPKEEAREAARVAPSLAEEIRTGRASIPAFSSSTEAKLEKSAGFQHLISYTNRGFEPRSLAASRGETIRFTNNSSGKLWVAADGSEAEIYPRTRAGCGSSDLDSCEPIVPQDFWEFTFELPGTWHVVNNLDESKGVVITIR
jgi:plastocyanin